MDENVEKLKIEKIHLHDEVKRLKHENRDLVKRAEKNCEPPSSKNTVNQENDRATEEEMLISQLPVVRFSPEEQTGRVEPLIQADDAPEQSSQKEAVEKEPSTTRPVLRVRGEKEGKVYHRTVKPGESDKGPQRNPATENLSVESTSALVNPGSVILTGPQTN